MAFVEWPPLWLYRCRWAEETGILKACMLLIWFVKKAIQYAVILFPAESSIEIVEVRQALVFQPEDVEVGFVGRTDTCW